MYLSLVQAVQGGPHSILRACLLGLGVGVLHLFHLLCKLGHCHVLLATAYSLLRHDVEGQLCDDAQPPHTNLSYQTITVQGLCQQLT